MIPRFVFAAVWLPTAAFAIPPLTTIQDVLYKADGTRFRGALTISWNSFQASDNSTVLQQSINVSVSDGNLLVKLVPTTNSTPATVYKVTYNSDGRVQFYETWSVSASTQPLRLPQVRVASGPTPGTPGNPGGGTTAPAVGSIEQDVVIGLVEDLEARPIKGPGFAPNRAATVNLMGQIESAVGLPSDCVRVDGSSGPCGGTIPGFIDNEALSGAVDGVNLHFTLAGLPDPLSSVALYRNGLLQKLGVDYTITLRDIFFLPAAVPQSGDILQVSYRVNGSANGPPQPFPLSQVLCSGVGGETTQDTFANLGACTIPEGLLSAGDRIELRFDYQHHGAASAFTIDVQWGSATVLNRDAPAIETLITGRADAGLYLGGAQLSAQSWGVTVPLTVAVTTAPDDYTAGLVMLFRGKLAAASGDILSLRHFSVVRLP